MVSIVIVPHPALRKISKPVLETDIKNTEFKRLLQDLSQALATRDDGVGLSAPQIAINKRVFVVSGKVFDKNWLNDKSSSQAKTEDEYFINPKILKVSKKLSTLEEGCLSIPEIYGMVKRPATVTMEYFDKNGENQKKKATGILARIFQHEIDHLDGILFTDKATDIKRLTELHDNSEL
jgi:peptide deformylase